MSALEGNSVDDIMNVPTAKYIPRNGQSEMVASSKKITSSGAKATAAKTIIASDKANVGAMLLARISELENQETGKTVKEEMKLVDMMKGFNSSKKHKGDFGGSCDYADRISNEEKGKVGAENYNKPIDKLVKLVQDSTLQKGYLVTAAYAEKFLRKNDKKLVETLRGIEEDLKTREKAFEETGRVSSEVAVPWSPTFHEPWARDEAILFLEDEDRHIQEFSRFGMASFLGTMVVNGKPHSKAWSKMYSLEANTRDARADLYALKKSEVAEGKISAIEMSDVMRAYDMEYQMEVENESTEADDQQSVLEDGAVESSQLEGCSNITQAEDLSDVTQVEDFLNEDDNLKQRSEDLAVRCREEVNNIAAILANREGEENKAEPQQATEGETAAGNTFVLPEEFPFQEEIAGMSPDAQKAELEKLQLFMEQLENMALKQLAEGV